MAHQLWRVVLPKFAVKPLPLGVGRFNAKEPIDGIFKSVVADLQVTQIVPDENSHDN